VKSNEMACAGGLRRVVLLPIDEDQAGSSQVARLGQHTDLPACRVHPRAIPSISATPSCALGNI